MFGSDVLDVAIGVTLLFLFASLICTAVQEAIETVMRWRAMDLERGIREILQTERPAATVDGSPADDRSGAAADPRISVQKFFDHPYIYALFSGEYDAGRLTTGGALSGARGRTIMPRAARMNLPTYIPSGSFAATLVDLIRLEMGPDAPLTFETLKEGAKRIPNGKLRAAALAAVLDSQGDVDRLRRGLEHWYDAAMDRVSGWYKRRTQMILLGIGLVTAALFNIDAIQVARHLATDKAYREAVVAEAGAKVAARDAAARTEGATTEEAPPGGAPAQGAATTAPAPAQPVSRTFAQARADLEANGFILGWPAPQVEAARRLGRNPVAAALFMAFGWIVTALAVSLGAPFWFDVLNKFMVVRSTVKPAEKSGREGSKDGQGRRPAPPTAVAGDGQPGGGS